MADKASKRKHVLCKNLARAKVIFGSKVRQKQERQGKALLWNLARPENLIHKKKIEISLQKPTSPDPSPQGRMQDTTLEEKKLTQQLCDGRGQAAAVDCPPEEESATAINLGCNPS
jgi:hypothetical protein